MSDPVSQIVSNHKRKHEQNTDQDRCKHCNAYVSKGDARDGVFTYDCYRCGVVVETQKTRVASVGD